MAAVGGDPAAAPGRPSSYAAALRDHLARPIRGYFHPVGNEPLPPPLAALVARFEAAIAARGQTVAFDVRADLVLALPALRTFALSLCGDAIRADDLVQDTFAKAWANQHRFRPGSNVNAWLFTILRNQFYTDRRKARREVEDADGAYTAELTARPDQDDVVALRTLCAAIAALPKHQRDALLLVGADGFTYEQAAARMRCSAGTVKSRVSRARSVLADRLPGLVPADRDAARGCPAGLSRDRPVAGAPVGRTGLARDPAGDGASDAAPSGGGRCTHAAD